MSSVTYRYPIASLVPDGIRALAGLAFTGIPLAALPVARWFAMVLAAGVVLFGVFGVLTALRARIEVRVDDGGIRVSPGGRQIRWSALEGVKLRYFAIRRERERVRGQGQRRGWMQLVLKGDDRVVVRIDSRLDGFGDVLRRSAVAAAGLQLDPVTRANFEAAGLTVGAEQAGQSAADAGSTGARARGTEDRPRDD